MPHIWIDSLSGQGLKIAIAVQSGLSCPARESSSDPLYIPPFIASAVVRASFDLAFVTRPHVPDRRATGGGSAAPDCNTIAGIGNRYAVADEYGCFSSPSDVRVDPDC